MVQRKNQTPTLPILDVVDALIADVRRGYPDIPNVTVVLGASGKQKKAAFHGKFHADQWEGDYAHEITLSGESLVRGPEATLGTLIHELAHARAHATGVQDTSRQGRYHNSKFKKLAEEMGLIIGSIDPEDPTGDKRVAHPVIGWSETSLSPDAAEKYAKNLERLREVLKTWKKPTQLVKAPTEKTTIKIGCECFVNDKPLTVTVPKSWYDNSDVFCAVCDQALAPVK